VRNECVQTKPEAVAAKRFWWAILSAASFFITGSGTALRVPGLAGRPAGQTDCDQRAQVNALTCCAFRNGFLEDAMFDPYREDPSFQQLLVKLNFVEKYKVARSTLAAMLLDGSKRDGRLPCVFPDVRLVQNVALPFQSLSLPSSRGTPAVSVSNGSGPRNRTTVVIGSHEIRN
jgi:hypothetical protein